MCITFLHCVSVTVDTVTGITCAICGTFTEHVTQNAFEHALKSFVGEIQQVPPMSVFFLFSYTYLIHLTIIHFHYVVIILFINLLN